MTVELPKNSIVLVDASTDSLTISWPEVRGAKRYILEYRKCVDGEDNNINNNQNDGLSPSESFQLLSDKLTSPQARKRNLSGKSGFFFRGKAVLDRQSDDEPTAETWITHQEPFYLLNDDSDDKDNDRKPRQPRMKAPKVSLGGSSDSLIVAWQPPAAAAAAAAQDSYELQMRENAPGAAWTTVVAATQKGTLQVRKRNLTAPQGYQFRVRPVVDAATTGEAKPRPFSPPSEPLAALGYSDGLRRIIRARRLLQKSSSSGSLVDAAEALGGKEFVLLYASAHWCGPCRQFTPQLAAWYASQNDNRSTSAKTVEVVFLSADHDENSFQAYYKTMPWLAVPYDDDAREELMAYIRVTGIPRLAVLDARTGRIIEDNAVGKPLDVNRWRTLLVSHGGAK